MEKKSKARKKTTALSEVITLQEQSSGREAPSERSITKVEIISPMLNPAQLGILLNKTPQHAIKTRIGPGGRTYKYVPHGYVTDTLNKAFGFDWDLIVKPMSEGKVYSLEFEEIPIMKNGKPTGEIKIVRHVAVCGELVIRVHNPIKPDQLFTTITKSGFGSQIWLPTMELGDALKAAKSDLLKVCAVQLGIALDLYWDDQAEINGWQEAEERKERAAEAEKRFAGAPDNFASLLSKALEVYDMKKEDVENLLGVTIEQLISYDRDKILEAWERIIASKENSDEED